MDNNNPEQERTGTKDSRLDSSDMQLRDLRKAEAVRTKARDGEPAKGMRQGNRVLTELIAGPAGGALLGWVIDRFAGTTPRALLACLSLGMGVAFRNIYRISQERPE